MKILCPFCNQKHEIQEDLLCTKIQCENCNQYFICKIEPIVDIMFFDIETTSIYRKNPKITTIVYFANNQWHHWINGKSNDEKFLHFWNNAGQVVSFNGKAFDEYHICKHFNVNKKSNHIDLMHELKKYNLSGGLKNISNELKLPRPKELDNVDGEIAVKLWKIYIAKGNQDALEYLLYYNAWDVVLTYMLYESVIMKREYGFISESIPYEIPQSNLDDILLISTRTFRKPTGKIKEYWKKRKKAPLVTLNTAEICFTGELNKIDKDEAIKIAEGLGAINKKSAVRKLDFLVIGDTGKYGITRKQETAENNIANGAHTRILNEDEFWKLVEDSQKV